MGIFKYFNRKQNIVKDAEERSNDSIYSPSSILYNSYSSYQSTKSLTVSSVFRAVNLISDSVASLQLKPYEIDYLGYKREYIEHPLFQLLGTMPNSYTSRYMMFKLLVMSILLNGNAYVYIRRDKNFKVVALELLNPDSIDVMTIGNDIKYIIKGIKGVINSADMIHILNFPKHGSLIGQSTISYASSAIQTSYDSDKHASNYFRGGANSGGFLTGDNNLSSTQKNDIINTIKNSLNVDDGVSGGLSLVTGLVNARFISPSINPKDSQLLETRQYNVIDIARFFSVNPVLLFDTTRTTYNNAENAQLDFLQTTLMPLLEKIENEFTIKLIKPSERTGIELKFDVTNLLRLDSGSKADYYTKMKDGGFYSINEVRKELNLPRIDTKGADKHFISTNLQDSDNLIVNSDNSLDNKLKKDENI